MDADELINSALSSGRMLRGDLYHVLLGNADLNIFNVKSLDEVWKDGLASFTVGINFGWMLLGLFEETDEAWKLSRAIETKDDNYAGKIIMTNDLFVLEGQPEWNEFRITTITSVTKYNNLMFANGADRGWVVLGIFAEENGANEWQDILRMYVRDKDGNVL
jgi:hypothetical protein